MNIILNQNECVDDLHRNNYKIIQNKTGFCFGIDAVLLSSFAKIKANDKVLDIGTGTGIIPILLEAKNKFDGQIHAIDIQKQCVDMAKRSVKLNNLDNKIKIYELDIKNVFEKFNKNEFNVITTNPPYVKSGSGLLNENTPKAISRHEIFCTLEDIVLNSSKLLKNNGKLFMIHRPDRLADIIYLLKKYKLEPKTIRFVQPNLKAKPNLVLIEAIKGAGSLLNVLTPLIIYNDNNEYTKEVFDIYYN